MGESIPFTQKYQPTSSQEVIGQESQVNRLKDFVLNYKLQKKPACLVYGPTGCGKTSSIHAIAKELDLEILEVNASDVRNKEQIESIIGTASKQRSLFFKQKVILVDEIDGLSGMNDRGGIPALAKLIEESSFPIICTATDPFDKKFSSLRKSSIMVDFQLLSTDQIFDILKRICAKENIEHLEDDLKTLARRVGGDARAAVNDFQMIVGATKKLTKDAIDDLSQREQVDTILTALMKVFKTTDPVIAITSFDSVNEDLDESLLWVDENLPKEYEKPADLARAYDFISRADLMKSRIRRWQHWRFLLYVNAYLSAGVAVSKDEKYKKFVKYERTKRLLKIWMANAKYQKRKAIAEKIAEKTHTSTHRIIQDTLPYIQEMFMKTKDTVLISKLSDEFDLDNEEVMWLKKG